MGYYIQTNSHANKADYLVEKLGGQKVNKPASFEAIPQDKALVIVVDNGLFEAAGLIYSADEFQSFTLTSDTRYKQYVLLDKQVAYKEAGYQERS